MQILREFDLVFDAVLVCKLGTVPNLPTVTVATIGHLAMALVNRNKTVLQTIPLSGLTDYY